MGKGVGASRRGSGLGRVALVGRVWARTSVWASGSEFLFLFLVFGFLFSVFSFFFSFEFLLVFSF